TNSLTAAQILAVLPPQTNTIRRVGATLEAPYSIQAAVSVERQLPAKTTLAVTFVTSRTLHALRAMNVNAPVCSLQLQAQPNGCATAKRPQPSLGNIYEYE